MSEREALSRRSFLALGAAGLVGAAQQELMATGSDSTQEAMNEVPPFALEEVSLGQLQQDLTTGKYTAAQLVALYTERIAAVDKAGPLVNAVIEMNPDAAEIAARRDEELKQGKRRGPLHGIPILLKDNIATADKMATTAGSLALVNAKVPKSATVAARLVNAGAVILGKTNLSEWANFRSSHSVSGWSARGGQTRNPNVLDRTPSGSSSGSGAATAASMAAACVGTETDGSIISPSAACGIVGIKPTVGLVSRTGIIPIAFSQDTAGPMARTVRDAAILLGAMVCADTEDAMTQRKDRHIHADYTPFLDPNGLKGKRIGICRKSYFGYSRTVDKVAEEAIAAMKAAGAVIIDPADHPTVGQLDEFQLLLYEFKAEINKYLAWLGPEAPVKNLKELIAFNDREKASEMPFFAQELFTLAQAKGPLTTKSYLTIKEKCRKLSQDDGIDKVMNEHKLDALFAPTQSPPALIDLANGDAWFGMSPCSAAAIAGYPSITVPAGYYFNLPIGVCFFGRAWSEPTLIKIAYAFEQQTKARKAPLYLPTAPFPRDGKLATNR